MPMTCVSLHLALPQEVYSETADVFSFAIIMYELLHRYMMISATDGSFEECKARAGVGRREGGGGVQGSLSCSLCC
jgi:hypothetical protein